MILNVFSIIELFIAVLSIVLMSWGGIVAASTALRWMRSRTPEERNKAEDRSHLVLLVAVVVLGVRLANWPWFYAVLQSFVPEIEGAMCIFGVTQVQRTLTGISEALKPITFFLIGGWLALHSLDQRTENAALMGRKLIFLSVTAGVVVIDAALDMAQMLTIAPGQMVSCCTTVTDVLERPTREIPEAVIGPAYTSFVGYGSFALTIGLVAAMIAVMVRIRSRVDWSWRRMVLGLLFGIAILNAALFLLAQIEGHAPRIMGLPFHHCLYCLWQYVPDTIIMYTLFIVATSAVGWAFTLDAVGRVPETKGIIARYITGLYGFAIVCFVASMIMNAVHLLIV